MKEGWKRVTLGGCCKINSGKSIKSTEIQQKKDEGLFPCFGGNGLRGYVPQPNQKGNNPIIGRVGAQCGNVHFCDKPFYATEHALVVTITDNAINSVWFCWLLKSMNLGQYAEGAAQPVIAAGRLKNISIVLPPLPEQQRIVEYLDSTYAEIDALKAKAAEEVCNAKAMFDAALREEMTPKEGWEEMKFSELCHFVRGPFGGSLKKECFVSEGYAVYEQQNAIYNKFTFRYYVDKEKYESLHRFAVNPGNLIMSCSGTIGRVAIIPSNAPEGIINQALLMLSPKGNIDVNFLRYLMTSDIFNDIIASNSDGAAIKNIASVAILKTVNLSIPTLNIQQHIVSHLDNLSSLVTSLEQKYSKIAAECDALKQAILRETFE